MRFLRKMVVIGSISLVSILILSPAYSPIHTELQQGTVMLSFLRMARITLVLSSMLRQACMNRCSLLYTL